jgi:hypothetical protein
LISNNAEEDASSSGGVSSSPADLVFRNANILLNDLIIDDDDDAEIEAEFAQNLENEDRRETLIFKQKATEAQASQNEIDAEKDANKKDDDDELVKKIQTSASTSSGLSAYANEKRAASSTLSSSHSFNMACEVASLTSVYSNYSQFDFAHSNHVNTHLNQALRASSPSPPPSQQSNVSDSTNKESSSFKKPLNSTPPTTMTSSQSNSSGLSSFLG